MSLTEELCSKFCEQINLVITDENVISCNVVSNPYSPKVSINVLTDEDEYNFAGSLNQKGENYTSDPQRAFLVKGEDTLMTINDISIKGYKSVVLEEVDMQHLKSILKCLAFIHSKSIDDHYFRKVVSQDGHSLHTEEYLKIQDILFDLVRSIGIEGIEENLFREGVRNLSQLSEEALRPKEENVYVKNNILQNSLIFKYIKEEPVKCKIINVVPVTHLPLVYDVLLAVFHYSSQKLRQQHFHELTEYYYHALENNLRDRGLNLSNILPPKEYQMQIKSFTPYVKMAIVCSYCQQFLKKSENSDGYTLSNVQKTRKNLLCTAISELYECFLYPNLTREDCYEAIRNKIGPNEYDLLNWSIRPLDDRPGFLGDYYKLKITIAQDSEVKVLNLFAKYLPTTIDVAKDLAKISFLKEEFIYTTFTNELKSLGLEQITDFAPNCYFSRSNDVLIFEDLSVLDYGSLDKTLPVSYETALLLIKKLAKLHACSLLYEEMMTKKAGRAVRIDEKYKDYVREANLHLEEINDITQIARLGIDTILNYIMDLFPDIPKEITMEEFKERVKKAFNTFFQKLKKSDQFRNVICQGDSWGANFMFKKDKNGTPVDCYIIDYQLTRYCPPTHDLFFFIYVNCDKQTRQKYMHKFIEEYYNELTAIVQKYNFDMNKLYTYDQFLECCKYMKSAGVCVASLWLPFVVYPTEKMQELITDDEKMTHLFLVDRTEFIGREIHRDGPYRRRIREIIEDLYEICVNNDI